jgi:hypothetical protein
MASLILAQGQTSSGFDYLQTAAIVLAVAGVIVAMIQIRRGTHSSRQSRQADLSWSMYLAYVEPPIRKARGTAEALAHSPQYPKDAQAYHDRGRLALDVRRQRQPGRGPPAAPAVL